MYPYFFLFPFLYPCFRKTALFFCSMDFCFFIIHLYIFEVNQSRKSRQHFGSIANFGRNLIPAMSACKSSKGPSKLYRVEKRSMFFLCSAKGVYKVAYIFSLFYSSVPLASLSYSIRKSLIVFLIRCFYFTD